MMNIGGQTSKKGCVTYQKYKIHQSLGQIKRGLILTKFQAYDKFPSPKVLELISVLDVGSLENTSIANVVNNRCPNDNLKRCPHVSLEALWMIH